jgi:P4 family phage/plasmid primase-like protien
VPSNKFGLLDKYRPVEKPARKPPGPPPRDKTVDLGRLKVGAYLGYHGIEYTTKDDAGKTIYKIDCLFDEGHKKEGSVVQSSDGRLTYYCFHKSCRGYKWKDARAKISGDANLAQWHDKYTEVDRRRKEKAPVEGCPGLLVAQNGKADYNPSIHAAHLKKKHSPLVHEFEEYGNQFWKYKKTRGFWLQHSRSPLEQEVVQALGVHARPTWMKNTLDLLRAECFLDPEIFMHDPYWINCKNVMLNIKTGETAPHAPSFYSRTQIPVNYNEKAPYVEWEDKLLEMFPDDPDKVIVHRQFFGYCFLPKIIFPCAMLQIGSGGNGKGVVQDVLAAMMGPENCCNISLKRMESRFGPVQVMNKLVNITSETTAEPLDVTAFKQLTTGDWVQAERKNKEDVNFQPFAKHLIAANSFPKIKEKTHAFFRRIWVVEYKQRFEGKTDNTSLRDHLYQNLDGVLNWALKGLREVLENNTILETASMKASKNIYKQRINSAVAFIEECCVMGPALALPMTDLWRAYKQWCSDSNTRAMQKGNFQEQVRLNYPSIEWDKRMGTQRCFRGIELNEDWEWKE